VNPHGQIAGGEEDKATGDCGRTTDLQMRTGRNGCKNGIHRPVWRAADARRLSLALIDNGSVDLTGDAYITFTAPFYADRDPLKPRDECVPPEGTDLDGTGALVRSDVSLAPLLQGSLVYEPPTVDVLAFLEGSETWRDELRERLGQAVREKAVFDRVDIIGTLFPDGYGSVAATLRLPGGWERDRRDATLAAVGRPAREALAAELRAAILPPLERTLRRCGISSAIALPYFNMMYAGDTEHAEPGRAALSDDLRSLVYPDSPTPLVSCSPWRDEFLFAGYAFNLLAGSEPRVRAEKMTLLLLILDVSYARLARTAAAADETFHRREVDADLNWLGELERRLRVDYQALVTPTFSFDHHTLRLRDAVLRSWDAGKLQTRTENLLATVRRTVEQRAAAERDRRIRRVNQVVTVVALLSAMETVDAAVNLFTHFFR
jgi:hypothetical protein